MDSSKIQERVDMKQFRLIPYVFILGVTYSVVYASDAKLFNGLRSGFLQRRSDAATGFIPHLRSQTEGGKIQKRLNVTQIPVQDTTDVTRLLEFNSPNQQNNSSSNIGYFLRKSRNSPHFMKHAVSLPCSRQSVTCSSPQPDTSNPRHTILFP